MADRALTYNDAGTHVHVRHQVHGGVWECPSDFLAAAREQGWEPYDPADDTTPPKVESGFDPAEHTVPQVNAHLEAHAEDSPGEVARVLELEAAGKNRSGIKDPRDTAGTISTTTTPGD